MTPTVYPVPADRVRDLIERARCGDEQADFIVHALAQYGRKAEQSCIDCRHAFIRRRPVVKPTQRDAIDWAKAHNPDGGQILVERVRNTDRGHPDKWRKP